MTPGWSTPPKETLSQNRRGERCVRTGGVNATGYLNHEFDINAQGLPCDLDSRIEISVGVVGAADRTPSHHVPRALHEIGF